MDILHEVESKKGFPQIAVGWFSEDVDPDREARRALTNQLVQNKILPNLILSEETDAGFPDRGQQPEARRREVDEATFQAANRIVECLRGTSGMLSAQQLATIQDVVRPLVSSASNQSDTRMNQSEQALIRLERELRNRLQRTPYEMRLVMRDEEVLDAGWFRPMVSRVDFLYSGKAQPGVNGKQDPIYIRFLQIGSR